jgi:nucleotide-binding universal stress UspA family protein
MFRKLLVPLDGSPEAAVALSLAQPLAEALSANVKLVRIVSPWEPRTAGVLPYAETYLNRLGDGLQARNVSVQTALPPLEASPTIERDMRRLVAEAILKEARSGDTDLIVMATRGRGGSMRVMFGSVAEHVLAYSPIPVLLLRSDAYTPSQIRRAVVAVDGTPGGSLALGGALGMADALRLELVLVRVVLPTAVNPYAPMPGTRLRPYVDPAWDDDALAASQIYVDRLSRRLAERGAGAQGRALVGDVPETIVRVANETAADLIIMSTYALTGPARAALGSAADSVVRSAGRPVLLFRRGAAVGE